MIKNLKQLKINKKRKELLQILDYGLEKTKPELVLKSQIKIEKNQLKIQNKEFDLLKFKRIFVVAIGKSAGDSSVFLEKILKEKITKGYCIDVSNKKLKIIKHTTGTHPYPSKINTEFSKSVVSSLSKLNKDDLVIIVISGGGSSLFCMPFDTECEKGAEIFKKLTEKGADIKKINTVRKHISSVKGGQLAKIAYPATVLSLIFSDVPGNKIEMIASGPTVKDKTKISDAKKILKEYKINYKGSFFETPKENKYFKNVHNFLISSNKTTISAMLKKAEDLKIKTKILKKDLQKDSNTSGKFLLSKINSGELLLAGGETTVKITGNGKGGRNQHTVLATLPHLKNGDIIISCASDGCDYTTGVAGAIGDFETIKKAEKLNLDIKKYLKENNSFDFFKKTKDQIITKKTGINVSDIFLVYKK